MLRKFPHLATLPGPSCLFPLIFLVPEHQPQSSSASMFIASTNTGLEKAHLNPCCFCISCKNYTLEINPSVIICWFFCCVCVSLYKTKEEERSCGPDIMSTECNVIHQSANTACRGFWCHHSSESNYSLLDYKKNKSSVLSLCLTLLSG